MEGRELQIARALLARGLRPRGIVRVRQMNAWLAEILELPARRTLRVGREGEEPGSNLYTGRACRFL